MPYDEDDMYNPANREASYLAAQTTHMARCMDAVLNLMHAPRPDDSAAIIERAREIIGCRGCGRVARVSETEQGYCAQCWHHLGQREVA